MKAGLLVATIIGLAATPALAKQETIVNAPSATASEETQPAAMINHAADLVEEGKFAQARELYERIEKMNIDYKLETLEGSWMFPAEIARRGLKEISARSEDIQLASAR